MEHPAGIEPAALRLTGERSAAELRVLAESPGQFRRCQKAMGGVASMVSGGAGSWGICCGGRCLRRFSGFGRSMAVCFLIWWVGAPGET